MKVLLIQKEITHYRVPFFNALADLDGLELTVAHSGASAQQFHGTFREVRTDCIRVGALTYQKKIHSIANAFDIVIAPLNPKSINSLLFCIKGRKHKFIYWGHGVGRSRWGNSLRAQMVQWADAAIFYSEKGRRAFARFGNDREKLFVAPNTLDVSNAGFDSETTRSSFLFVGRIQRRKGIDKLFKAFASCLEHIPRHIRIEIVGEGEMRRELEGIVQKLGISERVTFWGRITDDSKLVQIFQRSLAYVSPDHVGLGVLHSFAYGVPVVTRRFASHAPEVDNIKNGTTGLLYDGSISSLTSILQDLAQHPGKSMKMGRVSYQHYRQRRRLVDMLEGFTSAIEYVMSGQSKG